MNEQELKEHLDRAVAASNETELPETLRAEWEILECLGRNAKTETLLVRSRTTGKRAVAKCFAPGDPAAEMQTVLEKLCHPAIPRFITRAESAEGICILREYFEGETLAEAVSNGAFSKERAVGLAVEMCGVLTYLHTLEPPVIHRDIKPENIILRPDGSAALIDFGIARVFSENAGQDTRVMGTALFAPPEQYGFRQTDCRADLYALGIVLGWLLTGSAKTEEQLRTMPISPLRSVLVKCTAFDPDNRYGSAQELKQALIEAADAEKNSPGKKKTGRWAALCAAVLAAAAVFCVCCLRQKPAETSAMTGTFAETPEPVPSRVPEETAMPAVREEPVVFAEPLIEQAVRKVLGKSGGEELTAADLAAVEGLYVFGQNVCGSEDEFYAAAGQWYGTPDRVHGSIKNLADAALLPNLRKIMLGAQEITDISALTECANLEKAEFKHNRIADVSPLEGLDHLFSVGINDNPCADISPLTGMKGLRFLDLCDANNYDPAALETLGDMEFLDISNRTGSYKHIGTRRIRDLRLGWTELDSLELLRSVTGLERLGIEHAKIVSLAGIEAHPELRYIRLTGCAAEDLEPLKALPVLETVVIGSGRRADIEALGTCGFTVEYEE